MRIEEGIRETVNAALDSALFNIKYNLSNVFGELLYSLKLENEKIGGVGDINNLIRIIVDLSRDTGPEGEEYPTWDENEAKDILNRLATTLQAHGIKDQYNETFKV